MEKINAKIDLPENKYFERIADRLTQFWIPNMIG